MLRNSEWGTISFILIFSFLSFYCSGEKKNGVSSDKKTTELKPKSVRENKSEMPEAEENKVRKVISIGSPDTSKSMSANFYMRLVDLAYYPNDILFVLDDLVKCVRVFSIKQRNELFKFGSEGSQDGQFKMGSRIRYVPPYGLIVIDNFLHRATLFSEKGKVLKVIPLRFLTDDITFINDTLALTSSFNLQSDFKPLRYLCINSSIILEEFGSIVEPQEGIITKIKSSPYARNDSEVLFSYGFMTRILLDRNKTHCLLSQRNPYTLLLYDLKEKRSIRFNHKLPYSTDDNLSITYERESRSATIVPSAKVLMPGYINGRIVVPIFSSDCQDNFLDCYDSTGIFIKRLRIPPLDNDKKVIASVFGVHSDLYILVKNSDGICWIEVLSIDI